MVAMDDQLSIIYSLVERQKNNPKLLNEFIECFGLDASADSRFKTKHAIVGDLTEGQIHITSYRDVLRESIGEESLKFLVELSRKVDSEIRDTMTPLHLAAKNGYTEVATILLQMGADVNKLTARLQAPLHLAAIWGQESVASVLLDWGAKIETKTANSDTPLHVAAFRGHAKLVKLLLHSGAQVESRTQTGETPLILAALFGHNQVVGQLIACGADLNTTAQSGDTALHCVAKCGCLAMAVSLLERGAQVNARNDELETPLHLAVYHGLSDVVGVLLDYEADPRARNRKQQTPLDVLENSQIVGQLPLGSTLRFKTEDGDTALHKACLSGRIQEVEVLLRLGADPNSRNSKGSTPLHYACRNGHKYIMRLLVNSKVDLNCIDNHLQTPAHICALNGELGSLKLLLSESVNMELEDTFSRTPLEIAAELGDLQMIILLVSRGANTRRALEAMKSSNRVRRLISSKGAKRSDLETDSLLHKAAQRGLLLLVKVLLILGADPNVKNKRNQSPIHYAALNGYSKITDLLLENGAEPEVYDDRGNSPLILAVSRQHLEITKSLINSGARPITPHLKVESPIKLASKFLDSVIMSVLTQAERDLSPSKKVFSTYHDRLKMPFTFVSGSTLLHTLAQTSDAYLHLSKCIQDGANPNCLDISGAAPIHHAARCGHLMILSALVKGQANMEQVDGRGWTALHYTAHYQKSSEMCYLLGDMGIFMFCNIKLTAHDGIKNINQQDIEGKTALHIACEAGFRTGVQNLLRSGADPTIEDCEGKNCFQRIHPKNHSLRSELIKLKVANLYGPISLTLNKKDQELISNCLKELDAMKRVKFCNGISLFNLLQSCELFLQLEPQKVVEKLLQFETKQFPEYDTILINFLINLRKRVDAKKAKLVFQMLLAASPLPKLPEESINMIVAQLPVNDLEKLLSCRKYFRFDLGADDIEWEQRIPMALNRINQTTTLL